MLLGITLLPAPGVCASEQAQELPRLELLERAHTAFAQGDYPTAEKYYLEVLPSFPNNFDILRDLAYCYFVTGPTGYPEAAKYYARAYRINPRSSEAADKLWQCYMALKKYQQAAGAEMELAKLPGSPAETWKRAAEAYEAAGNHPQSSEAYLAYLQRNPGDLLARSSLAHLYSLDKNYDKAAEQYRLALAASPDFSPALTGLARILSWQGQLDESLELYERVLRFDPDNAEALSGKAFVLLWQKHYGEALTLFKVLHRRYPQDAEAERGLREAQRHIAEDSFAAAQQAGDVSELLDYYRERVAKNPRDLKALEALSSFSANAKHCSQSIVFGRKALEVSHGAADVQLALARSLRLCQNYTEAISIYRRYLQTHPQAQDVQYELGDTLRRARRFPEALEVFQKLVQSSPGNLEGQVGLGQALAATGQYDEALIRFNRVLEQQPNSYDALQGKAFVLLWKNDLEEAQPIFEILAKRNSADPENARALKDIARAKDEEKWKTLRPPANAPPRAWLEFYRKWLESHPEDRSALKGRAYAESELNNPKAAIEAYRQVLKIYPEDRDSKLELARLLSLDRQYASSISLYQQVLKQEPNDPTVLGSLGRVYLWAGQPQEALAIYRKLLAQEPANTAYRLEEGKLEVQLKNYLPARQALGYVLSEDPENREARLEIAHIDMVQGQYDAALKHYEALLKTHPQDPDALLGKARVAFYEGKFAEAQVMATEAVNRRPGDFSSVFLLASIEHALHHRRQTLDLLHRAETLSPEDPEAASLRTQALSESKVTIRTTIAYAREIGPPGESGGVAGLAHEDLRMYTYGSTIGLDWLPKTTSYFSFASLPTDSPPSPELDSSGNRIPTGITGAAAPYQFLYRQSTRFGPRFTVRAGAGIARFGPGTQVSAPGETAPITSAGERPLGLAGASFGLTKNLSLDFDATRSAITYTPLSARLGVIQDELLGRLNYFFNSRMEFHLAYWHDRYSSEDYVHTSVVNGLTETATLADHEQSNGGSIILNRTFVESGRFSLAGGYEGLVYGFVGGGGNTFMGFFSPSLYQSHELVPRVGGTLWGPLGYDLSAGIGIQQTGRGGAITRAWNVSPGLSIRVSRHLRLVLGYTHYNTAEALGPLRGNEVRLTTEWQY
jgi:tetratricopeptide (TPR) repeat protein